MERWRLWDSTVPSLRVHPSVKNASQQRGTPSNGLCSQFERRGGKGLAQRHFQPEPPSDATCDFSFVIFMQSSKCVLRFHVRECLRTWKLLLFCGLCSAWRNTWRAIDAINRNVDIVVVEFLYMKLSEYGYWSRLILVCRKIPHRHTSNFTGQGPQSWSHNLCVTLNSPSWWVEFSCCTTVWPSIIIFCGDCLRAVWGNLLTKFIHFFCCCCCYENLVNLLWCYKVNPHKVWSGCTILKILH